MAKNESIPKKIYKLLFNGLLSQTLIVSEAFSDYYSFKNYGALSKITEIMVHPDIKQGQLVDVVVKNKHYINLDEYNYPESEFITYQEITK